ncbi:MAG: 23S rRNA (adenine(2503)-C(2))-methyltransferase RlmN [Paludibacteraceae bacterium]|nr:23S rRNA (adenine(2503)-C(2))-methyltransferase RlmN [Paludibacteraceae bacterium]
MEALLGKTLQELQDIAESVGLPRFAGKQLAQWLYVKRVSSFDGMSNISLQGRAALAAQYTIGRTAPVREAVSADGTRKYLFRLSTGEYIETVYIPESERATLCVSTQAGCKMGCRFCMTGTLGFHGHLQAADILNQILYFDDLTNVVFMGEGEPMDNPDNVLRSLHILTADYGCAWSPKRITVSTVGIPAMKRFLDESECHLAISMHNPFPKERTEIMPAEKLFSIAEVVALLKQYDWTHQRRVSFEYICWHGVNDSVEHEKALVRLLRGLPCRVNLIRFHAGVDRTFPASDEQRMIQMRDSLTSKGLTTTIRTSRGEDISAACGMLVAEQQA